MNDPCRSAANQRRLEYVYANLDTLSRDDLIAFCMWNDPNGCYNDEDMLREWGEVSTLEGLRAIVRAWRDDK